MSTIAVDETVVAPPVPVLSVRDLRVRYAGTEAPVLHDIALDIHEGSIVALVGESGSGKSTLAHAILGLLPWGTHASGSVRFGSERAELLGQSEKALNRYRGSQLSFVPQDPAVSLNPVFTIGRQLSEVISRHGGPRRGPALSARVAEALADAGLPDPGRVVDRYPHELSGGMCQRVLIAMAWASSPVLVVADEPTSALDVTVQRQVLLQLASLRDRHRTSVLLVTHDLDLALEHADRVVVLRDGRMVDDEPADRIVDGATHEYTRLLLGASATVRPRVSVPVSDEIVLAGRGLRKRYDARRAKSGAPEVLQGVDLDVRRGESVAIVGESGSGKTTLARILAGIVPATAGTVSWSGREVSSLPASELRRARGEIQFIYQNPYSSLNPRLRIQRIVGEPLRVHGRGVARRERDARVREAIERVALPVDVLHRRPHELSGGQRQRVAIARAIVGNPSVLILDEPVSALDVSVQRQVLDLLRDLREASGLTFLLISHDLAVVREVADRVVVMDGGQIVERADSETIFRDPRHPLTRRLIAAIPRRPVPARPAFSGAHP